MEQVDDKLKLAELFLDHVINPNDCIDTFGRTYIDDLEYIFAENHGYDFAAQTFRRRFSNVQYSDEPTDIWFERIAKPLEIPSIAEFITFVRNHKGKMNLANVRPRIRSEELYETDASFRQLRRSANTIERLNDLQREWSKEAHKSNPLNESDPDIYEYYMNWDRVSPWTYLIRREMRRGTIDKNDKVVCIGNRWSGEVRYFRDNIGLKNAIGLDLFSADPKFVIAADMHEMPFDTGSVKVVFARGVANKSYDFRLWVKELERILAPDGFLIIEQPVYNHGVDILGATDLKSSKNLLRLLRGRLKRIVYTDDVEGHFHQYAYNGERLVKIFVQFAAKASEDLPRVEPFPDLRFHLYHYFRVKLLARRLQKRYGVPMTPYKRTPRPFRFRVTWSID